MRHSSFGNVYHGFRNIYACELAQADIRGRQARIDFDDVITRSIGLVAKYKIDAHVSASFRQARNCRGSQQAGTVSKRWC
jgi:hypothetical protein